MIQTLVSENVNIFTCKKYEEHEVELKRKSDGEVFLVDLTKGLTANTKARVRRLKPSIHAPVQVIIAQ